MRVGKPEVEGHDGGLDEKAEADEGEGNKHERGGAPDKICAVCAKLGRRYARKADRFRRAQERADRVGTAKFIAPCSGPISSTL